MNPVCDYFLTPLSPVWFLILGSLILIGLECVKSRPLHGLKVFVTFASIGLSMAASLYLWSKWPIAFAKPITAGADAWVLEFAKYYKLDATILSYYFVLGLFGFLSLISIDPYFKKGLLRGEVLTLILFILSGMMLLVSANNLLMVFTALELLSLPTYVLVGIRRHDRQSCEAALKYFLFGSFASVLIVLGIAILYMQFGSFRMDKIYDVLSNKVFSESTYSALTVAGLVLFLVGIGFKIGIVPFHMWLPDVYQGAPTPITGFMGSAIKLAGFVLAIRVLGEMFLPVIKSWGRMLDVLAVLTMFVGNLAALVQSNLKRMFAYSSISHAGYLFLGISVLPSNSNTSALFYYLVVYGLMFIGTFSILTFLEEKTKSTQIDELSGVGFSHPLLGVCLAIFAISAAGIPPTAGFFSKYFIFFGAVQAGKTGVVILGVLSSMIGVYYYLRVLVQLYMKEPTRQVALVVPNTLAYLGVLFCAFCLFYFSIFPSVLGVYF